MAKFIILSDCRFNGEHHVKGETIELNLNVVPDNRLAGELSASARIGEYSEALAKQVSDDLRAEKAILDHAWHPTTETLQASKAGSPGMPGATGQVPGGQRITDADLKAARAAEAAEANKKAPATAAPSKK